MPMATGAVTSLLKRVGEGDRAAEDELLRVLYRELHRIARRHMRGERRDHTLQPTALVNEAYVRLLRGASQTWEGRVQFLAAASATMRNILVDHARRRAAAKRGGGRVREENETEAERALGGGHSPERIMAIDEALSRLGRDAPRKGRIVELRFFVGFTDEEVAQALGISLRTVKRDWALAKAWLYQELRS
jgi:RNA polymerase sigma factor (TIGR02999 family)